MREAALNGARRCGSFGACTVPSLAAAVAMNVAAGALGQATFRGLSSLMGRGFTSLDVHGVSADGAYLVGSGTVGGSAHAFRWTASQGMVALTGEPHRAAAAFGVSANGAVVVGRRLADLPWEAFRWSWPLEDVAVGGGSELAAAVSSNGMAIVGHGTAQGFSRAYRWTGAGGVAYLGVLPGRLHSMASAVSATGAVVAGESWSQLTDREAFVWTAGGGMVGLGALPGATVSAATSVSADGTTVVGDGFPQGFRWTWASGMIGLGTLTGGGGSAAADVSGDGRVVVGGRSVQRGFVMPFLWTPETGILSLKDYLEDEQGLNLTGWDLGDVAAISDDGRVIIGRGAGTQGPESWMATLPAPPCATPAAPTAVIASDGALCGAVRLSWSGNPAHVGTYEIWRGLAQNGAGAAMIGLDGASPFFDATGAAGTAYWYFVRARNSCGRAGPFAGDAGFHVAPTEAPGGVAASDGTMCGFVRVSWEAVGSAASYTIWRSPADNPGAVERVAAKAASPFYDVPPSREPHHYFVKAVTACGEGPLSAGDVGFRAPVPMPPGDVTASNAAHPEYIRVAWTACPGATYTIWRATSSDPSGAVPIGTRPASPFFDTPPTLDTFWYFVRTHSACGTSTLSAGDAGQRSP